VAGVEGLTATPGIGDSAAVRGRGSSAMEKGKQLLLFGGEEKGIWRGWGIMPQKDVRNSKEKKMKKKGVGMNRTVSRSNLKSVNIER